MKELATKFLTVALFILTLMCVNITTTQQASADTVVEQESNDTRETATPFSDTITGTVDGYDEDWLSFTAPSDGWISADITLVNPNGDVKLWDEDYYINTTKIQHFRYCDKIMIKEGDVFFVHYKELSEKINYTIKIKFTADKTLKVENEPNNTRETAESISGKVDGVILNNNDYDWFSYKATQEGYLDIEFNPDIEEYKNEYVYLSADINTYSDGTIYGKGKLRIPIQKNQYCFMCVDMTVTDIAPVNYTVSIKFTPHANMEAIPNGSDANANRLTLGIPKTGIIECIGDKDCYYYKATQAEEEIKITVTCKNPKTILKVNMGIGWGSKYSDTGNKLSYVFTLGAGENLYIRVEGVDQYVGEMYTIVAEKYKAMPAISGVTLSKATYLETGSPCKPSVTVKDKNGNKVSKSNYTVTYSNNIKAGTATATVKFKGDYVGTKSIKLSFKIKAKPKTVKTSKSGYSYTGKAIKPKIVVCNCV